ncbi:MAG: hypothetical protein Q7R52_00375 [archaeon]|nr:hypothetical protein [archaeon]
MKNVAEIVGIITLVIGVVIAFALLLTIPTWLLWNWLMPIIFGLPKVTILQTLGLLLLVGFLFGSKGGSKK